MSTCEDVEMAENDSSVINVKQRHNQSIHLGLDSRFSRFNIFLNNALERIASGVGEDLYANLLSKLPMISKSKSAPGKMHNKIKTNLFEALTRGIEDMVADEKIEEKFKKLDELLDKAAIHEGKNTWRPNSNVNDYVRSHLMVTKLRQNSLLEETIREKERCTAMLYKEVSEKRAKVRMLQRKLEVLKEQSDDTSILDRIDKKIMEKAREF